MPWRLRAVPCPHVQGRHPQPGAAHGADSRTVWRARPPEALGRRPRPQQATSGLPAQNPSSWLGCLLGGGRATLGSAQLASHRSPGHIHFLLKRIWLENGTFHTGVFQLRAGGRCRLDSSWDFRASCCILGQLTVSGLGTENVCIHTTLARAIHTATTFLKTGPRKGEVQLWGGGRRQTPRATCTSPHAWRLWSQWRHHSQPPGPGSGTESWLSGLGERETRNGCHYQKEEAEATAVMTSPARGTWAPRTPLSFIPVLRSVGVTQRGGMAMAAQERPEEPRRQKRWCHLRNQSRPHLQGTCKRGNDSIGEPSRSEKPD